MPTKKTSARTPIIQFAAPVCAVTAARAELQASSDAVKVASRALVLAQRRAEDARVGLARAIEDRSLVEGV